MSPAYHDDALVASLLDYTGVRCVLEEAFADLALGAAGIFPRTRSDCGDVKLSAMGAIWPAKGVAGAKVYPTVEGQFSFLINLFDLKRCEPLAILQANEVTRLRTAAIVNLVALRVVPKTARKLAVIGAGVQGKSIAEALLQNFKFSQVCFVDPAVKAVALEQWSRCLPVQPILCSAEEAVRGADMVVTASRSKVPVFDGSWLKPGAFVAAVGVSLPNGRELDDLTLARAGRVIVEWKPQSLAEAGEIVLGKASGALESGKIIDLPDLYRGQRHWRAAPSEIVVFKSVGVGLADVATAWLAVQRMAARSPEVQEIRA
ncbi:MAG: ornithine cyclodeaminase family protein [Burkholderiales bacterium]|nr:ornithine cyclodeaminase family protein [Burkholderiales bacterium]